MMRLQIFAAVLTGLLLTLGCGKKTTTTSGDAPTPTETVPSEEPVAEAAFDPGALAADECSCLFQFPTPPRVPRPELQSCIEDAYAAQGIPVADANTPRWEWSPNPDATSGKVTIKVPHMFEDDADMEQYAARSQECTTELVGASIQLAGQTWTEAPCSEQCAAQDDRNRPLCLAVCSEATGRAADGLSPPPQ